MLLFSLQMCLIGSLEIKKILTSVNQVGIQTSRRRIKPSQSEEGVCWLQRDVPLVQLCSDKLGVSDQRAQTGSTAETRNADLYVENLFQRWLCVRYPQREVPVLLRPEDRAALALALAFCPTIPLTVLQTLRDHVAFVVLQELRSVRILRCL